MHGPKEKNKGMRFTGARREDVLRQACPCPRLSFSGGFGGRSMACPSLLAAADPAVVGAPVPTGYAPPCRGGPVCPLSLRLHPPAGDTPCGACPPGQAIFSGGSFSRLLRLPDQRQRKEEIVHSTTSKAPARAEPRAGTCLSQEVPGRALVTACSSFSLFHRARRILSFSADRKRENGGCDVPAGIPAESFFKELRL